MYYSNTMMYLSVYRKYESSHLRTLSACVSQGSAGTPDRKNHVPHVFTPTSSHSAQQAPGAVRPQTQRHSRLTMISRNRVAAMDSRALQTVRKLRAFALLHASAPRPPLQTLPSLQGLLAPWSSRSRLTASGPAATSSASFPRSGLAQLELGNTCPSSERGEGVSHSRRLAPSHTGVGEGWLTPRSTPSTYSLVSAIQPAHVAIACYRA